MAKSFRKQIDDWLLNYSIRNDVLLLCEIYTLIHFCQVFGYVEELKKLKGLLKKCNVELQRFDFVGLKDNKNYDIETLISVHQGDIDFDEFDGEWNSDNTEWRYFAFEHCIE